MKNEATIQNRIQEFIKGFEKKTLKFKPNQSFYNEVNINRKRWWQLFRNEKSATIKEMEQIAQYFDAKFNFEIQIKERYS